MSHTSKNNELMVDIPDSVWNIQEDAGNIGEHPSFEELADAIERSIDSARNAAARHVNVDQLLSYWNNGRMIVVYEQGGRDRAEYGEGTLRRLSKLLADRLGKGFSVTNLQYMRRFYLTHQKQQTLSVKLTWSHYCELLDLDDDIKRSFYEREAANSGWSVRELRRQMNSMLFERTLNARDDARRGDILALANKGVVYQEPKDAVRNPYVLEFLDLPDEEQLEDQVRRTIEANERRALGSPGDSANDRENSAL